MLVGPSGCGKSTTLRMIAGLEEITDGEIAVDGEVVNDVPPKDRDMAMVFQNYALYPHMTVYQNMSFGLRLKHYPEGRDREARAGSRAHPRHQGAARPQAAPALRRPAPARRDGPRDRAQSEGVPVRRAAVQPRRQAARADAHRDQARAPEGAHHHGLRHARPGRGDDARRPRGGDEPRQDRADRRAELPLSLAGDALRRGLHRLAGDELHSLPAGAGGRGAERAALRHDRLRGAGRARRALRGRAGQELTFGIRPEHLTEAKTNGSKNLATFDAGIEVVEPMGNETMVFFSINGTEVCARTDPNAGRQGRVRAEDGGCTSTTCT